MKYSLFLIFFGSFIGQIQGQNPENKITTSNELLGLQKIAADTTINNDTTAIVADTLANVATDTTSAQTPPPRGDIETTINYSARDSINFSIDTRIVQLYGEARIEYGAIELEADHITIDYSKNTLSASGRRDSTGQKVGFPIFKNGGEVYETKDIIYNFKTGRARITEVVTQQGEGYLHGETVFKNEKNELFSIDNTYTTCNLEHPHYRIRAKKTKAIPDDKIVSGPANLEINDVPTPLWVPFGMFPAKNEASSGIIIPSYGEERRRGFFLRGGGYFFDISDYYKATLTGDIYSKGGHGINFSSAYRRRYAFNGSLNFSYTQIRLSDQIENENTQNDYRLTWSHSPQSKGNSRFSASVNAATSSYNQNNFLGINTDPNSTRLDNQTRTLSSNVSYSKTFGSSPFSMGLSLRHNQDVRTKQVDLLLPSLTFNMSNVYPFRGKAGASSGWLNKLNVRYAMSGENRVTNNLGRIKRDPDAQDQDSIAPFDFNNLSAFLANSRKGLKHNIPLGTSFKLLKYFTGSPSLTYDEIWYFEQLQWGIDPDNPNQAVVVDTLEGFNRISSYSAGMSFNTRLYGTYFFKKGSIKAIRHVMNPSVSVSYRPNFSDEKYGYYQYLETETGKTLMKSRHEGSMFIYGGARQGESASVSFSLSNTLEMKVKTKKDTTDQAQKIPILKNFGLSTSYNMLADSFKLAPISLRANTALFNNKLSVNVSGTVNPYTMVLDSTGVNNRDETVYYQHEIDQYAWNTGGGIGQLTNANIALSTNLSPKAREKEKQTTDKVMNSNLPEEEKQYILDNPENYVDFDIPWSLRLNYSLNYRKDGFKKAEVTQSLRFSGDLSLTEKWKITFNSGYDFKAKEFTTTNLGITRDLHCWTMEFNWTPFGFYQNYNFTIRVKSSLLQDLKLNRTRSFNDRF